MEIAEYTVNTLHSVAIGVCIGMVIVIIAGFIYVKYF